MSGARTWLHTQQNQTCSLPLPPLRSSAAKFDCTTMNITQGTSLSKPHSLLQLPWTLSCQTYECMTEQPCWKISAKLESNLAFDLEMRYLREICIQMYKTIFTSSKDLRFSETKTRHVQSIIANTQKKTSGGNMSWYFQNFFFSPTWFYSSYFPTQIWLLKSISPWQSLIEKRNPHWLKQ